MVGPEEGGDLKVLRLRIRPSGASVAVVFELAVGGESLGTVECQLEELGWPESSRGYEAQDPAATFHLPAWLVASLEGLIRPVLSEGEILWLRFSRPSGGLGLLPWERRLAPLFDCPVVRWPYFDLASAKVGRTIEVGVCATMPQAKHPFALPALLQPIVEELMHSALPATFHVFVDGAFESAVRTSLAPAISDGRVRIIPPESAERFGAAPRLYDLETDRPEIESPWLRWMLAEGPGRLDLVLFLTHGFLSDAKGALAFSESPLQNRDREWARFVGSHQLRQFLDGCGAAMLALVSPPDNHSLSGLLGLADEVARDRPGPVLVHDLGEGDPERLGPTLSLLLGKGTGPLLPTSARALYALPEQVGAALARRGRPGGFSTPIYDVLKTAPEDSGEASRRALSTFTVASEAGVVEAAGIGWQVPVVTGTGRGTGDGPRGIDFEPTDDQEPHAPEPQVPKAQLEEPEAPKQRHPEPQDQEALLATSQRILERLSGDLLRMGEPTTEAGRARVKGRAEALKYVADLFKKVPGTGIGGSG
ncbi:MAG TPA: hypothetical protein VF017_03420 [Thermoanaerobaculia bacterium]|nr:hypothetical protein [Thermoanaerobaculia bacterium]